MYSRVLVVGAGKSGIAIANALKESDKVIIYDSKVNDVEDKVDGHVEVYEGENINPYELTKEVDTIIVSPGVPTDLPFLQKAKDDGKEIIGEIEAAYNMCEAKDNIIGITGTNGKTTTTSLVYEILKEYDTNSYALGNIGNAFAEKANEVKDGHISLELSSFQLELIKNFKPRVSAVLNITPDHLDRHKTMENYINCKMNVFKNQTEDDTVVLNYDDDETRNMKDKTKSKVLYFSLESVMNEGCYYDGENIILKIDSQSINENMCKAKDLKIVGKHNIANAMAAVLLTYAYGVPIDIIKKVLLKFNPVEHRIEYVRTLNGVKYYNDSKGTNTDSSIKAIDAMEGKIVIIIGGYDKHVSFDDFIEKFEGKVKLAIIIGQVKEQLIETCDKFNFKDYVTCETFEEAVNKAYENAEDGDNVLLSPACASWGMFNNYEERGRIFKDIVNKL